MSVSYAYDGASRVANVSDGTYSAGRTYLPNRLLAGTVTNTPS